MQIKHFPQYWRSLSLKVKSLVISVLVVALFLTLLPYMVKFGMERALMNQGADKVTIQDVSLNLFTGRFRVEGLKAEKQGQPPVTLGEFFVDLDWPALFKQHLVMERILLKQTDMKIVYHPDQSIMIAGIHIPLTSKQPASKPSEPSNWRLGLTELTLENTHVHILTPELNKTIRFDQVRIDHLQNWQPDQPAKLVFHLMVGEGKEFGGFSGSLTLSPFSETQKASGHIKIDNLLLQAYQNFLPKEISKLAAKIDGNFDINVSNHYGDIDAYLDSRMMTRNFAFVSSQISASSKQISLNGTTKIHVRGDHAELDSTSTLAVGQTQLSTPEQQLQFGSLKLEGQRELKQTHSGMALTSNDVLRVSDLIAKESQQSVQARLGQIDWQGRLDLAQQTSASTTSADPQASLPFSVSLDGKLGLNEIGASQPPLSLEGGQVAWSGNLKVSSVDGLQTKGAVVLNKVSVENKQQKLLMASFKRFATQLGFQSEGQALNLANIQLDQLQVAKRRVDKAPMVDVGRATLDQFGMSGSKTIHVGHVDLNGLKVKLLFDPNRQLQQLNALKASLPLEKPAEKNVKQPPKPASKAIKTSNDAPQIRFDGLDFSGKNRVEILTEATTPNMDKKILIQKLHIGKMDSNVPSRQTPVAMNATIDKYTKLSMNGEVQPFTPKVNLALKTDIKELSLYSFSPLIKRDLGYRIQSGSLSLQSDAKVKDDMLDSTNQVSLIGFDMAAEPAEGASVKYDAKNQQEASLLAPSALKFGLDMLRDNNNNIKLELPVKGNLADPDFNASGAINIALKKALTGGTKLALIMALQPYGAIAMATNYAMNQANKITFQPVAYLPGTTEMAEGMPEYLDKMGKLLKQKPQITLKVCGYYTDQDQAYFQNEGLTGDDLKEQLYDLAKYRQLLVKDWLVTRGGVTSDRLTTCYPQRQEGSVTGVALTM